MNIDIHSTPFEAMLQDLNKEIVRVIDKVYRGEFETGEINLKLSLTLFEDYKEFPVEDENGQTSNETYEYKRPVFEHNVTSVLKKQYKQKGFYTEEKEVTLDEDGHYIIKAIEEPQMSVEDFLY